MSRPTFPFAEAARTWAREEPERQIQRDREQAQRDQRWAETRLIWPAGVVFPPGCDMRQEGPIDLASVANASRQLFHCPGPLVSAWNKPEGLSLELWIEHGQDGYLAVLHLRTGSYPGANGTPNAWWFVSYLEPAAPRWLRDLLDLFAVQLPYPVNWIQGCAAGRWYEESRKRHEESQKPK